MTPHCYYQERVDVFQKSLDVILKSEKKYSVLRLVSFLGTWMLFYFIFNLNVTLAFVLLGLGLVVFAFILKTHFKLTRQKQHYQILLNINLKEIKSLDGDFFGFADGTEFCDKNHPYSSDLDIFGKASLFQAVNRTTSNPGKVKLASWLNQPAEIAEINRRQPAVAELKEASEWRQQLMTIGYKYADAYNNPETILDWVVKKPQFLHKKYLPWLINALSVLLFLPVVLRLPSGYFLLGVVVNLSFYYLFINKINKIHQDVSKTIDLLKAYSEIVVIIENKTFKSEKLVYLQAKFSANGEKASEQIRRLSGIVNRLDFRLNIIVVAFLNIFLLWDIRQILQLEKWQQRNQTNIKAWFDAMAEFEALCSLANVGYNNPEWIFPNVLSDHFRLSAVNIGHPLIPANRRVSNSIEIKDTGKVVLVTGSNMSGKSTFLRTCGVNIVMAMAGAPVCAQKFEVSHVMVYTSMRIIDSLDENTSSFYAELKRLAGIIQTIERKDKVFLLLDEILRGTNSNDRHIGSVALINQLIKHRAAGIIATHDLALSQLKDEFPSEIDNYNFDVKVENDELFFDYRLNLGICKSLNASILMKKMGIEI
ncbi:MAG: hypothetical protein Q8928_03040 [Bacteroidota bacterium]|nr:hypothetical protein [Bacteroidota bacterium]